MRRVTITKRIVALTATSVTVTLLSTGVALAAVALSGTDGVDRLVGTNGGDILWGLGGDDQLYGGNGNDRLRGEDGDDALFGDAGKDELRGGKGDDAFHADDGVRDRVSCGPGEDTVVADLKDRVGRNCEEVSDSDNLEGGVLATFDVDGERYRIWVTNTQTVEQLRRLRRGESSATIPNGRVMTGPGQGNHNAPYSWHIDPQRVAMAEATAEVCDAAPSYVEEYAEEYANGYEGLGRFCPWGARLVTLRDHTGQRG